MNDLTSIIAAHDRVAGIPGYALCACGWERPRRGDRPIDLHAEHVAEQIREARTIVTKSEACDLPDGTVIRDEVGYIGIVGDTYIADRDWCHNQEISVLWRPDGGDA